jgi:hypothetical protein
MPVSFIRFDDWLNEQLKNPEFKKGLEKEEIKLELELKFNEMLREMGYDDLCVEVLDMDEY